MKKYSEALWEIWTSLLPWLPVAASLCYLWGGNGMDVGKATIIAAVIALLAALLVDVLKALRNGKTIGEIKSTTTEHIKPGVDRIAEESAKQTAQLNDLHADLEHRRRLEAQSSTIKSGQDMMLTGTNLILAEYHDMKQQCKDLQNQLTEWMSKYHKLAIENESLRAKPARVELRSFRQAASQQSSETNPVLSHDDWELEP